jgi:DNA-binding NarL/FixJ family response regulator
METKPKIRILIIDDHILLSQTWAYLLNLDDRFTVVGECSTAEAGIERCRDLRPDVVLLDINLPGMNGMEAIPQIRKFAPCTKILGVSLHNQPSYARKLLQQGGAGYLTKNSSRKEMVFAVAHVHSGKKYICDEIKETLAADVFSGKTEPKANTLSQREMQIIELVKQGLSSKEIAVRICLSVKTVEVHRYNIHRKLNLKNAAQLVAYAGRFQLGLN